MRSIVCCTILLVLGMALVAPLGYAADFSADITSSTPEGSFTVKIYVSGDKSRTEMGEAIAISRIDKNVAWVLMPQQKMYMEQPLDPRSAASIKDKMDGEIDRKAVGNEKINGINTTKYLVSYKTPQANESVYQWIDETTHIPIKTAAIDGSWSNEFKNIKCGPQDGKLFEIPDGYKKMSFGMQP